MKRILGIDPGFATIGFGLIQAERGSVQMLRYGAITTPAGMPFSQRLSLIYEDMNELLKLTQPDAVSIEGHSGCSRQRCNPPFMPEVWRAYF